MQNDNKKLINNRREITLCIPTRQVDRGYMHRTEDIKRKSGGLVPAYK